MLVDKSFQFLQVSLLQSLPQGVEEPKVVLEVMDHEQDPRQELVGQEEVVNVGARVVPTAVTRAALHQGTEILSIPEQEAHVKGGGNSSICSTQINNRCVVCKEIE